MADRARRIARIAAACRLELALDGRPADARPRAAELAKFDLGSQMVIELTSLAGVMAREYAPAGRRARGGRAGALRDGAAPLRRRRAAGDGAGRACSRWPTGSTCWSACSRVGATPTGSSDPFGLRRAAIGVVNILREFPTLRDVTLRGGIEAAAAQLEAQGIEITGAKAGRKPKGKGADAAAQATTVGRDAALESAWEFVVRRFERLLLDGGHDHRFVAAVLPLADSPVAATETLTELERRAERAEFAELVAALQRVRRIVPAEQAAGYDAGKLVVPAELALHQALVKTREVLGAAPGGVAVADKADSDRRVRPARWGVPSRWRSSPTRRPRWSAR